MNEKNQNDALGMTSEMHSTLDKFFSEKTITDVDRNTFLVCNLIDRRYKLYISLVFMRNWDSIESNDFNQVILEDKGVVFTFPCYWVSIPKDLVIPYMEYIIDDFYKNTAKEWNAIQNVLSASASQDATGASNIGQAPIAPCPFIPAT